MKKLTRYHVLTAAVVVALLMVGGVLVASNMGFKLVDDKTFVDFLSCPTKGNFDPNGGTLRFAFQPAALTTPG